MAMHIILFTDNFINSNNAGSAFGRCPLDASPHALNTIVAAVVEIVPKLAHE